MLIHVCVIDDPEESGTDDDDVEMCEPGDHQWERQVCMICKVCNYCTGYGPGCCNQGLPDRIPGKLVRACPVHCHTSIIKSFTLPMLFM